MKKILIVTEQFYPYVSANTNCVYQIIDELQNRDCRVSVLTVSYQKDLPEIEEIRNCTVYRISVPEIDAIDRLLYRDKIITNSVLRMVRGGIGHFAFKYADKQKKKRLEKIFAILNDEDFDCILSVANPIGAHDLAFRLKDNQKKWVMYNLDAYVYNYSCTGGEEQRMENELRWCDKADAVINTVGIVEENERHSYFPYNNIKHLEIPLPNFEIAERVQENNTKNKKIVMRYTGMFYSNIRRPDELLKLLSRLDPELFDVEFYGSCCEYIKLNFKNIPKCLKLMGSVSVEECKELVESSDVLINVGNLCPNQIPSKIFEYISSGKPILNIYSTDKDPSITYLERYSSIINVENTDSISQDDLIKLASLPRISTDELKDCYRDCLRENVVNEIVEFIESI